MIKSDQRELFNFCGSRSWEEPAPLQRDAHAQSGCPHPAGPQRFFLALADLLPKCAAKPSGMPLSSAFQLDSCRTLWAVLAVAILGLSVQKVRQWHLSCLGPSGVGVGSDAPVSCKEGVWGWGVSRVSGTSERLGISGRGWVRPLLPSLPSGLLVWTPRLTWDTSLHFQPRDLGAARAAGAASGNTGALAHWRASFHFQKYGVSYFNPFLLIAKGN